VEYRTALLPLIEQIGQFCPKIPAIVQRQNDPAFADHFCHCINEVRMLIFVSLIKLPQDFLVIAWWIASSDYFSNVHTFPSSNLHNASSVPIS